MGKMQCPSQNGFSVLSVCFYVLKYVVLIPGP